jgi:hypothetical protein
MKRVLTVFLIMMLPACVTVPSEETIDTAIYQTQAAQPSTDTPVPTETPLPTATDTPAPTETLFPYSITITVVDTEGNPIPDAQLNMEENPQYQQVTNKEGVVTWDDLPGDSVIIKVRAQGYLPAEIDQTISRGDNDVTTTLERDPYGLLPSEILEEGESVVFIEDFQDGEEKMDELKGKWQIVEDSSEPGNMVFQVDQTDFEETASANFHKGEEEYPEFTLEYRFRHVDLPMIKDDFVTVCFKDGLCLSTDHYWAAFQIIDATQDEWKRPYQIRKNYKDGVWYSVKLEISGPQVIIYLDGNNLGRVSNLPESPIYWQLAVGENANYVQFDDIIVKIPGD